ncbi:hypothetical protein D4764_10G0006060 [Takifugu flavidus]|uniref:Uncharacterized protein n=1 Tax=Takifugu flavidus TaxID=433684 RepID=A0A5C6PL01_9TELE|nr:hypothetical protein D4764_10G0006060 [Takifugu flavidus]
MSFVETGALNAAGWRKVNRKQKVPMEEGPGRRKCDGASRPLLSALSSAPHRLQQHRLAGLPVSRHLMPRLDDGRSGRSWSVAAQAAAGEAQASPPQIFLTLEMTGVCGGGGGAGGGGGGDETGANLNQLPSSAASSLYIPSFPPSSCPSISTIPPPIQAQSTEASIKVGTPPAPGGPWAQAQLLWFILHDNRDHGRSVLMSGECAPGEIVVTFAGISYASAAIASKTSWSRHSVPPSVRPSIRPLVPVLLQSCWRQMFDSCFRRRCEEEQLLSGDNWLLIPR